MDAKEIISSGLLELHVNGLATTEESAMVLQYAEQFPEVAAELAAIEEALEQLAFAHAVAPNESIKAKIFAAIDDNTGKEKAPVIPMSTNGDGQYSSSSVNPISQARSISPVWRYVAAASVLLFVASAFFNLTLYQQSKSVQAQLDQSKQAIASLSESIKMAQSDMQIMQSKYSMTVALNKTKPEMDAAAKVFWMKNTGEVYVDPSNLPDAPSGMQYQLWAIVDGKPVDAGMIITTKSGNQYRIQKMKKFDNKVQAFAISLEKEAGLSQPKGEVVVMGTM